MINESIKSYFEINYTVEMQEVLFKVISLLDRLNINSYEGYILNTINEIENSDTLATSLNVLTYFDFLLEKLGKGFGFTLKDEITLEQRVIFTRGYVDLEDYIDHQAILRIAESDILDEEKIAQAVSLTTELSEDMLISFIDTVDESAIFTLARLHLSETSKEEIDNEMDSVQASDEQVTQIKAYRLFLKENNLTLDCLELVTAGYAIGLPFKVYWDVLKDKILSYDIETLSKEMIGVLLLSKEHWSNPLIGFSSISEDWFDNIKTIGEVNAFIRQLMSNFINFKVQNRIK